MSDFKVQWQAVRGWCEGDAVYLTYDDRGKPTMTLNENESVRGFAEMWLNVFLKDARECRWMEEAGCWGWEIVDSVNPIKFEQLELLR